MAATISPPRRRYLLIAALIVAVGVAGVLVGAAVTGDDGSTSTATAAQVSSVQQGCEQWFDAGGTMMGDRTWCAGMAGWMSEAMANGGMGPQMMWGDPARMQATCQQWMADNPPSGTAVDPGEWCSSMVGWMAGHMSGWSGNDSWDGWMGDGPMMGG